MFKIFKNNKDKMNEESKTPTKDLLPIGSIVVLKEGTKPLMIYGILQSDMDSKHSKEYDYIGVPYPEGNMGAAYQYLFNTHNIDRVISRGYEDADRTEFLNRLRETRGL